MNARRVASGLLSGLFGLLSAVAGAEEPLPLRLDFGSETSPLYEGFQRVTARGGEQAVWRTRAKLAETARPIVRGPATEADGRKLPRPTVYYTELSCDYVSGDGPAELELAVPPGRYKVWILLGHPDGEAARVWNSRLSTGSGAKVVNIPWRYEMRCVLLDGEADARGLVVRFDTENAWLVSGMVVAPERDWETVKRDVVDPLWEEYAFLPRDVAKEWKPVPPPRRHAYPEPLWSEAQRRDGFVVFSRPYCDPVWPEEFPGADEIDAPVRAFAAQGQYETLAFSIHPLKDFREAELGLSELVSSAGHRLPGDLRAGYVRYLPQRPVQRQVGSYYEGPDVVMPWETRELRKGRNLRVWLTARIPPHTPAGDYRGTATLRLDGVTKAVPLLVKVLPIALQRAPGVYSIFHRPPYRRAALATDDFSRRWWRGKAHAEYADMAAAGFTHHPPTPLPAAWENDRWIYRYDEMEYTLELGRRYGFTGPFPCGIPLKRLYRKHMGVVLGEHLRGVAMPPEAFFAELGAMVREVLAEARNRNWPEMLIFPLDEPYTNETALEFSLKVLRTIKEAGGRTYVTVSPADPLTEPLRPYIDVWCPPSFSLPAEALEALRGKHPGSEFWCYPNNVAGAYNHVVSVGARMTYGFAFWKSGFRGLIPWAYQDLYGDPWNNLDGEVADFMNRTADDGSVIPSTLWICHRAGVDDGRYLHTLARWIETAERHGFADAAAAARNDLAEIENAIPVMERYTHPSWEPSVMDAFRWKAAARTLTLRALVLGSE